MSVSKRVFSAVLAAVIAVSCMLFAVSANAEDAAGAVTDSAFVPVIRFVAASDTHVRSSDDVTLNRIGTMMDLAYDVAGSDANYGNIDALLIAGDLTNDGYKDEFDRFSDKVKSSLRGDTRFLGVVAKNHDGYEMKRTELRDYYKSRTGNDADFHAVINGFHFIGLSASPNDAQHYDRAQLDWLRSQLDEAVADKPDQPVFVMHHEHNRDTVYGSSSFDGWGVTYFNKILKNYPQVVDFSGHSHYPINDPRSIWQGDFTAIGTGAIYYSEFTIDTFRAYHPSDSHDTATCWIVEVDAQNNMHLRGYDVLAGECIVEYTLANPADKNNRDYTPEKRAAQSKAPVFAGDAAVTVTPGYGKCTIEVPAAESADGMPVVLYRAYAKNSLGIKVDDTWTLPSYYRAVEQDTITLELETITEGDYTVTVVAETAYGVQSEPLEAKVTLEGDNAFIGFFKFIGKLFSDLFTIIKNVF